MPIKIQTPNHEKTYDHGFIRNYLHWYRLIKKEVNVLIIFRIKHPMLKDSRFYLIASFFTIGVNFLTLPFFTQYLSPEDYGVIGLFLVFGNVVTNLCTFGLNTATYGIFFKSRIKDFKILNFTVLLFLNFIFIFMDSFLFFPMLKI